MTAPPPTEADLAGQLKSMVPYSRSVCLSIVQECKRRNHPAAVMGTVAVLSWRLRVSPARALQYVEHALDG